MSVLLMFVQAVVILLKMAGWLSWEWRTVATFPFVLVFWFCAGFVAAIVIAAFCEVVAKMRKELAE